MLIKSFEGFNPRALQRADGRWVIGYGHTQSAREGASVSEADAELLLRYDLLPVEKAVNAAIPTDLNQHQFDALVSFAFSVGLETFSKSDVRQRLTTGATVAAADAMMGWPEPVVPEVALRRRVAERALFVADPHAPVTLSDLLIAPPPPVEAQRPEPAQEQSVATEARGAAVAALLGEPAERLVQPETPTTVIPTFTMPTQPSEDAPESAAETAAAETEAAPAASSESVLAANPEAEPDAMASTLASVPHGTDRYMPYAAPMVGPLPGGPLSVAEGFSADPIVAETPEQASPSTGPSELVLTPAADDPAPALARPPWTAEEREAEGSAETTLFDDDTALTLGGGPILRHELDVEPPARFDWRETGPFIFMGGVGLVSFAAAMAAFRRAAEQSGGGELSVIGWVLALIGLGCVAVSSINLYRRFGLPGGD